MSGKLDLELNEDLKKYMGKAEGFWGQTEVVYKKIRQLSKQLIIDFD